MGLDAPAAEKVHEWTFVAADDYRLVAAAIKAGRAPDSDVAMDLAEAHRQHISRWFYECDLAQHTNLGELYVSDPRFIAEYDKIAPGFSEYVRQAIRANAERHGTTSKR